jgi:hypothetical protein
MATMTVSKYQKYYEWFRKEYPDYIGIIQRTPENDGTVLTVLKKWNGISVLIKKDIDMKEFKTWAKHLVEKHEADYGNK